MELIILRHGKAEDGFAGDDFSRELVEAGWRQARAAANFLAMTGRLPELVLTSPRPRALQTAQSFCEAAGMDGPVSEPWLNCGMRPQTALEALHGYDSFGRVMIVGHQPDLAELIGWLLGGSGAVEVKKGALWGLEIRPPSARGCLLFGLPPKMIARATDGG